MTSRDVYSIVANGKEDINVQYPTEKSCYGPSIGMSSSVEIFNAVVSSIKY